MLADSGVQAVRDALSGRVALTFEGREIIDAGRAPVRFATSPTTVSVGPVRRRTVVDGMVVYREGRRVLSEPLEERRVMFPGQSLQLTLAMAPR